MAGDFHDSRIIMFWSFGMLMTGEAADFRSMKASYCLFGRRWQTQDIPGSEMCFGDNSEECVLKK